METAPTFRAVLFLCLAAAYGEGAQENPRAMRDLPGPRCKVRSFNMNAVKPCLDGQWQGILAASDGKVYFAVSTHSGREGGSVFRYDPEKGTLETLAKDITLHCGEDPAVNPQGKMHSDFLEHKGWIYFATHFSSGKAGAAETYTGAHVLGLEMATGKFRDFGAIHPGYTIYSGIGVDKARDRLFTVTVPITLEKAMETNGGTRLYAIDIPTGSKRDLGVLNRVEHDSSSSFFVDGKGDCWFSLRSDTGSLYRVRGETLAIDRYTNALPVVAGEAWEDANVVIWSRPVSGGRCVFLKGDRWLWEFDPAKPLKEAFTRLGEVGPAGLGTDLANGKVYFARSVDPKPRGGRYFDKRDDHHLFSFDLGSRALTDHGLIEDASGRRPWRLHSLAADAKGRVYMTGDWYCKEEGEGMRRYIGEKDGQPVYETLRRGMVFAVWEPVAERKP